MAASFSTLMTGVLMSTAGKLLSSLGVGVVTYSGLHLIEQKLINMALDAAGSLSANALQICMIGGIGSGLNIIFTAIGFAVSYKSMSHIGYLMKR